MKTNFGLFGTATRSRILILIYMLKETYPSQVAEILDISLNQSQGAIESLEVPGIVVRITDGRQRKVKLNPRYAFKDELEALLQRMAVSDILMQEKLAEYRRRPRRTGKPL